jgi:hypothetical protein
VYLPIVIWPCSIGSAIGAGTRSPGRFQSVAGAPPPAHRTFFGCATRVCDADPLRYLLSRRHFLPQLQTEIGHGGSAHKLHGAHGILHLHCTGIARQIRVCFLAVIEYRWQDECRSNESDSHHLLYLSQLLFEIIERLRPQQRFRDVDERAREEASDAGLRRSESPAGDTYEWCGLWRGCSGGQGISTRTGLNRSHSCKV